jgi:hypothetical protein
MAAPLQTHGYSGAGSVKRRNRPFLHALGNMDDPQTKREIWFLVLGTMLVQVPVAIAAFAIMSH